jgi:rhodanese-related sulfurtransferase
MKYLALLKTLFVSAPRVPPTEAAARVRRGGAILVDVREPHEWSAGYADGAALLPLSDLTGDRTQWGPFLKQNAGRELLLYCAAGGRSALAAKRLVSEGFKAANAGGFGAGVAAGWAVHRP